jgi:hypothetical protein
MNHVGIAGKFALALSTFLIVMGVWELFSPVVMGAFSSNVAHGVIHIALGGFGLFAAMRGHASTFLTLAGALLLIVGVLWFIPATRHWPSDTLNVNRAVAVFNVIAGGVSLGMARNARRQSAF